MVKALGTILKRELRTYLMAPSFYVLLSAFTALTGLFFYLNISYYSSLSIAAASKPVIWDMINSDYIVISSSFSYVAIILLFLLPILTMKSIADERKNKTIELLMTSPLSTIDIILGKYFALWAAFVLMLCVSTLYPVILSCYLPIDIGIVVAGYAGLLLLGSFYLAVGILTSCFSENQLIAAGLAVILLICVWSLPSLTQSLGEMYHQFFKYISLADHFNAFNKGLIEVKSAVFFLTATIVCLVVSERILESERWR